MSPGEALTRARALLGSEADTIVTSIDGHDLHRPQAAASVLACELVVQDDSGEHITRAWIEDGRLHLESEEAAMYRPPTGVGTREESRCIVALLAAGHSYSRAVTIVAMQRVLAEMHALGWAHACPPCGDTGVIRDETTGRAWPCRCSDHARG